jgi:hypothetical protein
MERRDYLGGFLEQKNKAKRNKKLLTFGLIGGGVLIGVFVICI